MIAIPHRTLKAALQGLGTVCTGKSSAASYNHIMVCRNAGAVTLVARDFEFWLQYQIPPPPLPEELSPLKRKALAMRYAREARRFMVPLHALKQAIKTGDADSDVLLADGMIRYKIAGAETGIPFRKMEERNYFDPADATIPPGIEQWALTHAHLRGIQDAFDCASTDETRLVLMGAALCPDPEDADEGTIVGTDGRRLALTERVRLPFKETIIIPAVKAVKCMLGASATMQVVPASEIEHEPTEEELAEHVADCEEEGLDPAATKMYIPPTKTPPMFAMQLGCWRLVGRAVDGNYPNFRMVIPNTPRVNLFLPPQSIQFILSLLPRLGFTGREKSIELHTEAGKGLALRTKQIDVPVPGAVATITTRIVFDHMYLASALRMGLGHVYLEDGSSPAKLTDGANRLYVLMPMRATWNEPAADPKIDDDGMPESCESDDIEAQAA